MAMNCCVCHRQSLSSWGNKPYCLLHLPYSGREPDFCEVEKARGLMAQGMDLREAAAEIGTLSQQLDIALWRNLGRQSRARYEADF